MRKTYLLSLLALGVSVACHGETLARARGPSQSDFGGVGLLQTPTARMAREGEMSLNYRDNDQYRYYSASVQLFPRLETTLRYTDVRTKNTAAWSRFLAIRLIKIRLLISNFACGKRATGCRRWRLARGISVVPACLMRSMWWRTKPGPV